MRSGWNRQLERQGADSTLLELRDLKVRTIQQYPEKIVNMARAQWIRHGDAGQPYLLALDKYLKFPKSASVTSASTAQSVEELWNKAELSFITVEWRMSTESGIRWLDLSITTGGKEKTGREAAQEITRKTGFEFTKNVMQDPFAVADKNGQYRGRIAVDSGDLPLDNIQKAKKIKE